MASEYFYQGTANTFDPVYAQPAGYGNTNFAELSAAVDPRTANQIKEVSEHLNTGVKNIEVQGTFAQVLESIPEQHFDEIRRLAKLAGAELSMHAPMVDPGGITERGWDKTAQQGAEHQLWSAVERAKKLNFKGNMPVTMHASTVPLPPAEFAVKEKGEKEPKIKSMLLVDPDGNLAQIKDKEKFFPGKEGFGKKIPFDPKQEVKILNKERWAQELGQLNFYAHRGEELIDQSYAIKEKYEKAKNLIENKEELAEKYTPEAADKMIGDAERLMREAERNSGHGMIYLKDAYRNLRELYDKAYKSDLSDAEKAKLDSYAKSITPIVKKIEGGGEVDPKDFANIIETGVSVLDQVHPQTLKPLKDFAAEKSAETVANLAFKAYDKYGTTAPVISLENHPAGTSTLTTADDLKLVIEKARDNFVKTAMEKKGMSKGDAQKQAEKLIGATWDVGHINMLRKYGYDKDDIVQQTETIAPYVKHVHLSDNFGFEHTELPMGMGNVPIKEILKRLGKEGFEGKKVIEAGNWWQHFSPGGKSNSPLIPTMAGIGTPGSPLGAAPYGTMGGYFAGYGTINPEVHHSLYGAGFSALPPELGGQMPGQDRQKLSGTPMA